MKRCLALVLALILAFPLPALGAGEGSGFADVAGGDWFAPYVEVCVEEGLMEGTGEGNFAPRRELTVAEVIVLAARLCAQAVGEEIPAVPVGEELEPDETLVRIWPLFVDREELFEEGSDPATLEAAAVLEDLGNKRRDAILEFINQLAGGPTPYAWYLNEAYYLWEWNPSEMEELARRLEFQAGTAADTLAGRGDLGALVGQFTPSPVALWMPEDIMEADSLGTRTLILTGVMEGTGESYALDRSLTRAECAALLARMVRPELRKTPAVEERQPEELTGLEVWHGSFGRSESQYTLDVTEGTFTVLTAGYFQGPEAPDQEETFSLEETAVEAFLRSRAVEELMGWGPVYYNMNAADGHQWAVTLSFSDGTSREIGGSNAYPEGWDLLYDALLELTGKPVLKVRSDWLDLWE